MFGKPKYSSHLWKWVRLSLLYTLWLFLYFLTLSGTIWTSLGLFSWFQDICVNFQHFQEECKQEAESASPLLTVFRYLISSLFTAFHFISSALHSFTLLCWFFDRRRMTKWERRRSKQQKGHKNLMRSERKWSLVTKWKLHFLLAWSLH